MMSWFPGIDAQLRTIVAALTYRTGKPRLQAIEDKIDALQKDIDAVLELLAKPKLEIQFGQPTDKES